MEDLGFGFKIFLMWTIFKIFAKLATALLWSYILFFWPQDMWDLVPRPGVEPTSPAMEGKV